MAENEIIPYNCSKTLPLVALGSRVKDVQILGQLVFEMIIDSQRTATVVARSSSTAGAFGTASCLLRAVAC